MKQLLPLLCVFLSSFVLKAQNIKFDAQKWKEDPVYHQELTQFFIDEGSDTSVVLPRQPFALKKPKPGVHRLPLDNMPCIVPDPNATVVIPNLWQGEIAVPFRSQRPRIPNPGKPLIFSPARPLLLTPETK